MASWRCLITVLLPICSHSRLRTRYRFTSLYCAVPCRAALHMSVQRGLSAELAHQVAVELTERDVVRAHARDELGIDVDELANPLQVCVCVECGGGVSWWGKGDRHVCRRTCVGPVDVTSPVQGVWLATTQCWKLWGRWLTLLECPRPSATGAEAWCRAAFQNLQCVCASVRGQHEWHVVVMPVAVCSLICRVQCHVKMDSTLPSCKLS